MTSKDDVGTGRPGAGSTRSAAWAAASESSRSRSCASARAMRRSKSCRTTPRPNSCSRWRPQPDSTSSESSAAWAWTAASAALLPRPALPCISMIEPRPARASPTAAAACSSSASRSISPGDISSARESRSKPAPAFQSRCASQSAQARVCDPLGVLENALELARQAAAVEVGQEEQAGVPHQLGRLYALPLRFRLRPPSGSARRCQPRGRGRERSAGRSGDSATPGVRCRVRPGSRAPRCGRSPRSSRVGRPRCARVLRARTHRRAASFWSQRASPIAPPSPAESCQPVYEANGARNRARTRTRLLPACESPQRKGRRRRPQGCESDPGFPPESPSGSHPINALARRVLVPG